MTSHDDFVRELKRRPGVRAELDRLEREEGPLLDEMLRARHAAGLTQAEVAERMGTQAPAVAPHERALVTRKHTPSLSTLRRYAEACGKKLKIKFY